MPARPRRTQKQRRDETQTAILNAAVAALIELGFAKTTTLEVQRRAQVSRGALLHHFPSKAGLLAATVGHLAQLRGRELNEKARDLPTGTSRSDAVLELLWESFSGPLFQVSLELRTAARTDPELRRALVEAERVLRDNILSQSRRLFGPALAAKPGFDDSVDVMLQLMIGAAMTTMLHPNSKRVAKWLDQWKRLFVSLLNTTPRKVHDEQAAEI